MGFFSSLFGQKKVEAEPYTGPRPPSSLSEVLMGPEWMGAMKQMYNAPVGYGEDYTSRVSRPDVQAREQRYEQYERPELLSGMSARGMQRSSIASDLERRALGQREQDISQILGQAYGQQAQAKQAERMAGYGGYGQAAGLGSQMGANAANFGLQEYQATRPTYQQGALSGVLGPLLQAGAGAGLGFLTGGPAGAVMGGIGGLGGGQQASYASPNYSLTGLIPQDYAGNISSILNPRLRKA